MRNLIIIALTALLVAACAFLPELFLRNTTLPELEQQSITVTADTTSDYAWRMGRIGEYYYGDGENLLTTYISQVSAEEAGEESWNQFFSELNQLTAAGVVPSTVSELLVENTNYRIRYYYLFDSEALSGFRIAEFVASGKEWAVNLCMDVDSGKLAKVEYSGSRLIPSNDAYPENFTSWYDVLRGYGEYLGLTGIPKPVVVQPQTQARLYYDSNTADQWFGTTTSTAWMELRVLRENLKLTITVYNAGK